MRITLYILIALLFSACGTPTPKTSPSWYENRALDSSVKYEVIGYGEGVSIREAQANAKEDIVQILTSKVESSYSSKTTTKATNKNRDAYARQTQSVLKITSNLNLHNVKTIKQVQKGDIFYVALKYKNLDLAYRIITTIGKFECSLSKPNNYMAQTPLLKKLTASVGCSLDFKLDRRNKTWYLKYKEHLFLLSDDEFEELYISTKNDTFEFMANKRVLTDGDSFYFMFKAKKSGYITLLNVYENGIVTLLQASTPIESSIEIPAKDSENYFEAGLVTEGENTYDLYVAIYTQKPLDMSRFEYVDEELAQSEVAYKFDELIGVLNKLEFSSILLRTRTQ